MTDTVAPISALTRAERAGVPCLPPTSTLLERRDGRLQIGWRPESRVLLTPPSSVTAAVMAAVLRLMDGRRSVPDLYWRAAELGVEGSALTAVLAELERLGVVVRRRPDRISRTLLVLGRGPLADAVSVGLSTAGRVTRRHAALPRGHAPLDCVVLTDSLLCAPEVAHELMAGAIPHIPVRLRDGTGVVGPLVLPGHSSCLECIELTRCDYDREWPHLAAQLLGTVGSATPHTIAATAAYAISQVTEFLDADADSPAPMTVGHTIEVDLVSVTTRRRAWPRHRLCSCMRNPM